jgi:hypothetical protein
MYLFSKRWLVWYRVVQIVGSAYLRFTVWVSLLQETDSLLKGISTYSGTALELPQSVFSFVAVFVYVDPRSYYWDEVIGIVMTKLTFWTYIFIYVLIKETSFLFVAGSHVYWFSLEIPDGLNLDISSQWAFSKDHIHSDFIALFYR